MPRLVAAGNTVVPCILVLEELGFTVSTQADRGGATCRAVRGDEEYLAEEVHQLLGLVKLVESRGWEWGASDADIDRVLKDYDPR